MNQIPLQVAQGATVRRLLTQEDFDRFAALSGDDNPIHVDPDFARRTRFGRPVAHGMYLFGLICSVLGTRLPGPGTVLLAQELMFPTPTFVGEEVAVRVEVDLVREDGWAELRTVVERPGGEPGCQGRAIVRVGGTRGWPKTPLGQAVAPLPTEATAFKGLRLGQRGTLRRVFTEEDLQEYVDLTGDANPFHTDAAFARGLGLEGAPLPGALLGGLISCLLGTRLPGYGTNYLKQRFHFPTPAYPGEEVTATVEVVRLRPVKELVNLRTVCTNSTGQTVCDGEALVLVRDVVAR